jgi:hypothetical protein
MKLACIVVSIGVGSFAYAQSSESPARTDTGHTIQGRATSKTPTPMERIADLEKRVAELERLVAQLMGNSASATQPAAPSAAAPSGAAAPTAATPASPLVATPAENAAKPPVPAAAAPTTVADACKNIHLQSDTRKDVDKWLSAWKQEQVAKYSDSRITVTRYTSPNGKERMIVGYRRSDGKVDSYSSD